MSVTPVIMKKSGTAKLNTLSMIFAVTHQRSAEKLQKQPLVCRNTTDTAATTCANVR